ncbi:MAG: hypothetical protein JEZ00_16000 [Anaerolineaceae bacterium]|nr:hypothetical protein [Anaerolineaceae bacterium]
MNKITNQLKKIVNHPAFIPSALLTGFVVYLIQSINFAIHLDVTMDEGTYLIKGLYLVKGIYIPFQDYGFWMNKMPFAFTLPGLMQYIFAPGLRTGRFFSVVLNMIMLVGLWMAANRSVGKWWAVVLVWVSVLNSGLITYYVAATTQIQSAVFIIWSMVFLLGKHRKVWEISIGVILACIVVLIRQNLVIIVPIMIIYIFWKFGKKTGWLSVILSTLLLGSFHLYYWPNIMRIWAPWLPSVITKFLLGEKFLQGSISQNVNAIDLNIWSRGFAFVESFRIHAFLMAGTILSIIYWAPKKDWKSNIHFKDAIFTGSVFLSLALAHLWASVLQDACVFCYTGYIAFFSPIGLIFVALCLQSGQKKVKKWREWLGTSLLAGFAFGFGYASYRDLLTWVVDIPFFRIKNMHILPGQTEIWRLLHNKFGWPYENLERMLPAFFAMGVIIFLLIIFQLLFMKFKNNQFSSVWLMLVIVLIFVSAISPIPMPGGGKTEELCTDNMIEGYEFLGSTLKPLIPAGATVYWENQTAPLPLLYLQDIQIFPAQIDHHFNYLDGGDSDLINLYGYWNDELAAQWREEADYLLIEELSLPGMEERGEIPSVFQQVVVTDPVAACRPYSAIYIYERMAK